MKKKLLILLSALTILTNICTVAFAHDIIDPIDPPPIRELSIIVNE